MLSNDVNPQKFNFQCHAYFSLPITLFINLLIVQQIIQIFPMGIKVLYMDFQTCVYCILCVYTSVKIYFYIGKNKQNKYTKGQYNFKIILQQTLMQWIICI